MRPLLPEVPKLSMVVTPLAKGRIILNLIDTHLHFFDLDKGDYQWLKPENPPFWPDKPLITKNWGEHCLTLPSEISLAGYVHIEAGFDNSRFWREIEWLENQNKLPFRSIACIDLTNTTSKFSKDLNKFLQYQTIVGARHILGDEASKLLKMSNVQQNLKQLAEHSLIFELQMPFTNQEAVEQLDLLLSNTPSLSVIIEHAGFPPQITDDLYTLWISNIRLIAKHSQVAIKCSGWEMNCREYESKWALAVIEQCLFNFGQDRVMLASNFPLCLLSKSYFDYWQSFLNLPEKTKTALLNDNARRWYKF